MSRMIHSVGHSQEAGEVSPSENCGICSLDYIISRCSSMLNDILRIFASFSSNIAFNSAILVMIPAI
jgi:hypothetical protein